MKDLIKIYFILFFRTLIFKSQLGIRFILNGRCYPRKYSTSNLLLSDLEKDKKWRDFWIGWIAYKYFSKIKVNQGWLSVDFSGPNNDLIFVTNSNGNCMSKTFHELIEVIKINNKKKV